MARLKVFYVVLASLFPHHSMVVFFSHIKQEQCPCQNKGIPCPYNALERKGFLWFPACVQTPGAQIHASFAQHRALSARFSTRIFCKPKAIMIDSNLLKNTITPPSGKVSHARAPPHTFAHDTLPETAPTQKNDSNSGAFFNIDAERLFRQG